MSVAHIYGRVKNVAGGGDRFVTILRAPVSPRLSVRVLSAFPVLSMARRWRFPSFFRRLFGQIHFIDFPVQRAAADASFLAAAVTLPFVASTEIWHFTLLALEKTLAHAVSFTSHESIR